MKKIINFFDDKKKNSKFKEAGQGHSLKNDTSSSSSNANHNKPKPTNPNSPPPPSAAVLAAREAALRREKAAELARQPKKKPLDQMTLAGEFKSKTGLGGSLEAEREQIRREIEAKERKKKKEEGEEEEEGEESSLNGEKKKKKKGRELSQETVQLLKQINFGTLASAVYLIYFGGEEGKKKKKEKDKEEGGASSTTPSSVEDCVSILCKYIDNIIKDPHCEKFRRIRVGNRVFQERVLGGSGDPGAAVMFLEGMGFYKVLESSPGGGGKEQEEYFYVIPESKCIVVSDTKEGEEEEEEGGGGTLKDYRKLLCDYESVRAGGFFAPYLYRETKVLRGSSSVDGGGASHHEEVPLSFYNLTAEEVKREQQRRGEQVEKMQQLRTRQQREMDERGDGGLGGGGGGVMTMMKAPEEMYLFTNIRVRLPPPSSASSCSADVIFVQGTFKVGERVEYLYRFVQSCLKKKRSNNNNNNNNDDDGLCSRRFSLVSFGGQVIVSSDNKKRSTNGQSGGGGGGRPLSSRMKGSRGLKEEDEEKEQWDYTFRDWKLVPGAVLNLKFEEEEEEGGEELLVEDLKHEIERI